jgi:hypothetical protein
MVRDGDRTFGADFVLDKHEILVSFLQARLMIR